MPPASLKGQLVQNRIYIRSGCGPLHPAQYAITKREGGVKDYMTYRVANLMSCEIYGQEYIAEMCKPIRIRVKRMKDA